MNGIQKAGATESGREWQVHTTTHRSSVFPCIQNVNHKLFDLDATFWTPEFGQGAETHDRRPTPYKYLPVLALPRGISISSSTHVERSFLRVSLSRSAAPALRDTCQHVSTCQYLGLPSLSSVSILNHPGEGFLSRTRSWSVHLPRVPDPTHPLLGRPGLSWCSMGHGRIAPMHPHPSLPCNVKRRWTSHILATWPSLVRWFYISLVPFASPLLLL